MSALSKFFIPKNYSVNTANYNKAVLMKNVFLLTSLISLSLTVLGYYISYQLSLVVMPIAALLFAFNALLIKTKINLNILGNSFVLISSLVIVSMITFSGGIYSPVTPWIAAGPTFALLLIGRKSAWIWSLIMLFVITSFAFIEIQHLTPSPQYDSTTKASYYLLVYSSLIFIMLMVNLIFEKNKNDALQKVEEANKNIKASINYAQRIQKAILPTENEIQKLFSSSFVLFKPKDIISGDFYWVAENNGKKLVAAADCTGHGVPGALMSMIGSELLNKIVFEKKIVEVDKILNELHNDLCTALRQSATDVKDGMDIVLCSFFENTVEFSGAKNNLYRLHDGELQSIAANREAIGGDNLPREFKKHSMTNIAGSTFYLCTDGFQDQFGGENGKKFTVGKLKKTFTALNTKNINEQKTELEKVFNEWKKYEEQTDDVLIIGIRCL